MPCEGLQFFTTKTPNFDGVFIANRGNHLTIGTKNNIVTAMPCEGLQFFTTKTPNFDGVFIASKYCLAIITKGDTMDSIVFCDDCVDHIRINAKMTKQSKQSKTRKRGKNKNKFIIKNNNQQNETNSQS